MLTCGAERAKGSTLEKPGKPLWIKEPLAILADGAERGVVVEDGFITELVAAGASPRTSEVVIDGILPGLDLPALLRRQQSLARALQAGA